MERLIIEKLLLSFANLETEMLPLMIQFGEFSAGYLRAQANDRMTDETEVVAASLRELIRKVAILMSSYRDILAPAASSGSC